MQFVGITRYIELSRELVLDKHISITQKNPSPYVEKSSNLDLSQTALCRTGFPKMGQFRAYQEFYDSPTYFIIYTHGIENPKLSQSTYYMITPSPVANLAPSLPACHSITSAEEKPWAQAEITFRYGHSDNTRLGNQDTPGFASGQLRTKSHSCKYAQFTLGSMNRSPKLHLPMNQI